MAVDFTNQTVTVANAPTASGHVATKAYVDAAGGDPQHVIVKDSCSGHPCTATAQCPEGYVIDRCGLAYSSN